FGRYPVEKRPAADQRLDLGLWKQTAYLESAPRSRLPCRRRLRENARAQGQGARKCEDVTHNSSPFACCTPFLACRLAPDNSPAVPCSQYLPYALRKKRE